MKKLDGMMPPTFVFADEGKNGDAGPPPSSRIDIGTTLGLRMRSARFGASRCTTRIAGGAATSARDAAASAARYGIHPPRRRAAMRQVAASAANTPHEARPTCDQKTSA